MDRKMFEEGLLKKQEEALKMDKERDKLLIDIEAKKAEIAEIEGKPESTKEAPEKILNFEALQSWLRENNLEGKLEGGSLEKLIKKQEKYYQGFYSKDFQIDRKKITVSAERLPAIKKALEIGCVNYAMIKATPEALTEEEKNQTGAQYAYNKFIEPLKEKGFKIWMETGTERWTKLTLKEVLKGYIPVEPKDFNPEDLEKDWEKECVRIINKKGVASKQTPGQVEIIFTDSRPDIPREQEIVNIEGQAVRNKYSFIEAVKNKVKIVTPEEEMILASQLYSEDGTYLAPNTWEFNLALLDHRKKKTNPGVSVASAYSDGDEFRLRSDDAASSYGIGRWRVAL